LLEGFKGDAIMTIYWKAGAALVGYLILAWILGSVLKLDTTRFYFVFVILAALGIGATAVFIWLWRKRKEPGGKESGPMENDDEIDGLVREAENRLAASSQAKGSKLANLPVIFVLGDTGSTKTSTILHSGMDPELLAGNVYQDTTVIPTRLANIWFARGMIFVEAGGKLMADPQRWVRLLQRLRPGRLSSAVRSEQAPRAALLCFDSETFVQPGSAEALAAASRNLQKRLGEISQQLGVSYPVYILFTKMNRVAFFEDFVRNLTTEEAAEVLGATLPIRTQTAGGTYGRLSPLRPAVCKHGRAKGSVPRLTAFSIPWRITAFPYCRAKTICRRSRAHTSFLVNSEKCGTASCNFLSIFAGQAS
jgi:type VI secretion system protein ImpL